MGDVAWFDGVFVARLTRQQRSGALCRSQRKSQCSGPKLWREGSFGILVLAKETSQYCGGSV